MSVTRSRGDLLPDLVWLIPVVLAAAATCVTTQRPSVVLPLLVVALVPWVLLAVGRTFTAWVFGVAAIVPVVAILAVDGLDATVFLGTTAGCLLASRADRSWHLVVVVVGATALPFASLLDDSPFSAGSFYFAIGDLFGVAVGVLLGHSRRLDARLRESDARLAALAAQEERTQLARDVHDLVAHSLTVVVLQIGGARRVLRVDPARAETALEQAEHVCRESLDGVREVVGLLRSGDEPPGSTVDLMRLVETYRAAGVDVELDVQEGTAELPLLVRGTIYRVVQEALANAARYRTPDSGVLVRTTVDRGDVTVTVVNAGAAGQRSRPGGYGLTGLREQVTAIGGTLQSGPAADGWLVECRLPQDTTTLRGQLVVG